MRSRLQATSAEKFHFDKEEMEQRHSILFATYEEGRLTIEEYLDRVIFYKKIKQQYCLKIAAVGNEARELNAYRIQMFKLNGFIYFFVSSCYVHIRKPDARIFTLALDLENVSASEVIYIDDVQMFTDIAMELGIKTICHKNYLSTVKTLGQMGLKVPGNISNNHPV